MNSQEKRNGAIDFWKFVFALLIVVFHSMYITDNKDSIFIGGSRAVEFFFIVSGFLMAASAYKRAANGLSLAKDTVSFMKRKITGLIPEVYVAWVIAFVVLNMSAHSSLKKIINQLMSSVWELLFLWQSGLSGYRANGVVWYISAMLLAMVILYPLLRKYKAFFLCVIAPMTAIIIYGILYKSGTLVKPSTWFGFIYKGETRAIAGLCLGCTCYVVCEKLKTVAFTTLARILFSCVEIGGYVGSLAWFYNHGSSQADYFFTLVFAICITISFSRQGILSRAFDSKLFYWLGNFSLMVYLAHGCWSNVLLSMFPDMGYKKLFLIYISLTVLSALFVMFASKLLRKFWNCYSGAIKSLFIGKQDDVE